MKSNLPQVRFDTIGKVTYAEAWEHQTVLHKELIQRKLDIRHGKIEASPAIHHLLFCEHHHVYTLGKSGSEDHLLIDEKQRKEQQIEYFKINRGGDITYHGPGQLTGYPILDLEEFFTDIHKYVRLIEEVIIQVIAEYGLQGIRVEGNTGVWLPPNDTSAQYRKICAIGVHLSRWVTMHGFAFNINTDLDYFNYIIPCGIDEPNKTVTSLADEVGYNLDFNEVADQVKEKFAQVFDFQYIETN